MDQTTIDFGDEKSKRIRIRKCQRPDSHARICNDAVEDRNLKDSELAVLVYIMKKPPTWTVEPFDINTRFGWDIKKTYKVLNELKRLGYMRRIQERSSDGTMGKWFTEVSDEPIYLAKFENSPESEKGIPANQLYDKQPESVFPLSGKTDSGHLIREKKDLQNKETTTNKENVVVDLEFLIKLGFSIEDAQVQIDEFTLPRCQEVAKHVNSLPRRPNNPAGYARSLLIKKASLSKDLRPSTPYPGVDETLKSYKKSKPSEIHSESYKNFKKHVRLLPRNKSK
jgi:hypothetical protein